MANSFDTFSALALRSLAQRRS